MHVHPTPRQLKIIGLASLVCGLAVAVGYSGDNAKQFFAGWVGLNALIVVISYAFRLKSPVLKKDGKIPLVMRVAMLPYLLIITAYNAKSLMTDKRCSYIQGTDLFVRSIPDHFIEASLDMCAEYARPIKTNNYINICTLDLISVSADTLTTAVKAIEYLKHENEFIYINCALGKGRSVAVAIAWLLYSKQTESVEAAYSLIKKSRPFVVLPLETKTNLESWYADLSR